MNVFWHELRLHRKGTLIWAISIFMMMLVSMAKYQQITQNGSQIVEAMLSSFPSTVQAIFGMDGLDLATVGGYYGVCFLLFAVVLAIHAALTGAGVLAEEEDDKTTEFLYVKPRRRASIITGKLVAGLLMLVTVWGAIVAGSILGITKFATFGDFTPDFWRMMIATAVIQLTFFTIGSLGAVASKRSQYGTLISLAVFGSYFLYVIAKLAPNLAWLHYFSIFSWFDAVDILISHHLKPYYLIVSFVIAGVCLGLTYYCYSKRDLRV